MVMPKEAPLPGFTSPSRTNPRVLHNRNKANSLEWGSSIVTIVIGGALYYNKLKQIDYTNL